MRKEWEGFVAGNWTEHIDVEEFIKLNYHPYDGDGSFLAGPTERTKECSDKVHELLVAERKARAPCHCIPWFSLSVPRENQGMQ